MEQIWRLSSAALSWDCTIAEFAFDRTRIDVPLHVAVICMQILVIGANTENRIRLKCGSLNFASGA